MSFTIRNMTISKQRVSGEDRNWQVRGEVADEGLYPGGKEPWAFTLGPTELTLLAGLADNAARRVQLREWIKPFAQLAYVRLATRYVITTVVADNLLDGVSYQEQEG